MRTVYPQPGHTEADVLAVLNGDQYMFADLFTVEPVQGDPLRYTDYQKDVTVIPPYETVLYRTFSSRSVNITGLRMKASTGIAADEQDISLSYPDTAGLYQNRMTWPQAILYGQLDGARIRRDRVIRADAQSPWVGGWTMFRGLVCGITGVGRSSASIKVKSDLILLDTQMPKSLYEPNCRNTWGDPNCGVNQLDFMVLGTMGASPTRSTLPWSGANADFALGKVHIAVSTDSTIRVRTISRADASHLYLAFPLDFDPQAGDMFEAYPGCNRTCERCEFFHGDPEWKSRFKGFPFIPVAETAVGVGVGGAEGKGGK